MLQGISVVVHGTQLGEWDANTHAMHQQVQSLALQSRLVRPLHRDQCLNAFRQLPQLVAVQERRAAVAEPLARGQVDSVRVASAFARRRIRMKRAPSGVEAARAVRHRADRVHSPAFQVHDHKRTSLEQRVDLRWFTAANCGCGLETKCDVVP
eukprot:359915-Chlamydomonas_euryale.AAC.1